MPPLVTNRPESYVDDVIVEALKVAATILAAKGHRTVNWRGHLTRSPSDSGLAVLMATLIRYAGDQPMGDRCETRFKWQLLECESTRRVIDLIGQDVAFALLCRI